MTNKEIITQLEDIKCHCQEMYEAEIKNVDTSSSIWGKDVEALDFAIKALEQQKKILSYIDRLLNQGTGKKKSLEFLKKYILEGEKNETN